MQNYNSISKATGDVTVPVDLQDIQITLSAMRSHALKDKPEIIPDAEALQWLDDLSFDEVMLGAKLVATVRKVRETSVLRYFLDALISSGEPTT